MEGFVAEAERTTGHVNTDVMGYHDAREIPNYWTYAHDYVLQDHMFEPNASWSLPAHLFTVSEWSATCSTRDPFSCRNDDDKGNGGERWGGPVHGSGSAHLSPSGPTQFCGRARGPPARATPSLAPDVLAAPTSPGPT